MNTLQTIIANKHTSIAAIIYGIAAFGAPLLTIWMPDHKAQLDSSAELLKGAAVFYGFAAAGDARQSMSKDDAQTEFVRKPGLPPLPTSSPSPSPSPSPTP